MNDNLKDGYEAPKVEQIETEDAPAATAAGHGSPHVPVD